MGFGGFFRNSSDGFKPKRGQPLIVRYPNPTFFTGHRIAGIQTLPAHFLGHVGDMLDVQRCIPEPKGKGRINHIRLAEGPFHLIK